MTYLCEGPLAPGTGAWSDLLRELVEEAGEAEELASDAGLDSGWALVCFSDRAAANIAALRAAGATVAPAADGRYVDLGGAAVVVIAGAWWPAVDLLGDHDDLQGAIEAAGDAGGGLVAEAPGGGYSWFPLGQPPHSCIDGRIVMWPKCGARLRVPDLSSAREDERETAVDALVCADRGESFPVF